MENKSKHLIEDQIICAVVDADSIPQDLQKHIAQCNTCKNRILLFEKELGDFTEMADICTPKPKERFRFENKELKTKFYFNLFKIRPVFATLAVSCLIIFFSIWQVFLSDSNEKNLFATATPKIKANNESYYNRSFVGDEVLNDLYDNNFDDDNYSEYQEYFSDDFLDFVSPTLLANN